MTKQELFEWKIDPVDQKIYRKVKENWGAIAMPVVGCPCVVRRVWRF